MSWTQYHVNELDLQRLIAHNEPITVSNSNLEYNAGVELYTLTGNKFNAIYDANLGAIRKLNTRNPQFNNMPNRDLLLYNDHLLNPDINTVIVDGFFGTGKTSTACSHLVDGLQKHLQGDTGIPMAYISKPHESVGKGYGHLPGDLHDKTYFEFQSYTQYFNRFGQPGLADYLAMVNPDEQPKFNKQRYEQIGEPMLELLVFEYLRGRDIENGWVVLDETQNTDIKDISTFVSRVGDNAKLITIGDSTPSQIDKRGNTSTNNGLQFMKETYRGKKYTGYVELQTIKHILRGQRVRDLFTQLRQNHATV